LKLTAHAQTDLEFVQWVLSLGTALFRFHSSIPLAHDLLRYICWADWMSSHIRTLLMEVELISQILVYLS
jgi:hypothetical protein